MYQEYGKRILDFTVAISLIVFCSWLVLVICVCYMVTFNTPIFFTQKRIGKDQKIFTLFKFRTLRSGEGDLTNRTFTLGNVLRTTSLDELPQLLNVLKGDMSLIGPRPLPDYYLSLFSDEQRQRHQVRPGISGWAQVNGRTDISWEKKFELDVYYVRNLSAKLDFEIIGRTIRLVLSPRKDSSLGEQPFRGTSN